MTMQTIRGTKHICDLPSGYDERTNMTMCGDQVIIIHPDFQPCILKDDKLVPVFSLPPTMVKAIA